MQTLLNTQLDRGWRFSFAGCGMFLSAFAPCYPRSSSRHQFGVASNSCFILFQPDAVFSRHRVTPAEEATVRAKFEANKQFYPGNEGNAVVKPLDERSDRPVEWWKIDGATGAEFEAQSRPQKRVPRLVTPWHPSEMLAASRLLDESFVRECLCQSWQTSMPYLGPFVAFEFNTALLTGCAAVRMFEALPCLAFVGYPQYWTFGFHGTSEAAAAAICEEGFDPQQRKLQTYGPGEYIAMSPDDAVGYCKGSRKMVFVFAITPKHDVNTQRVFGSNLASASRGGFQGPVMQLKVNNPLDCSSSYLLPLGIVTLHSTVTDRYPCGLSRASDRGRGQYPPVPVPHDNAPPIDDVLNRLLTEAAGISTQEDSDSD